MSRKSLVVCILLTLASSALAEERAYPIQLIRPGRKGCRDAVECVAAMVYGSETNWNGYKDPVIDEKVFGLRFVADCETLQVDERDHELADAFVVRACTKTTDDGESEVLAPGVRIVARVGSDDEGTNFRVDGEVPSKDVAGALGSIIEIPPSDEATAYDSIFGSSTPRKPGESWPINAERAARMFVARGTHIQPSDVSGTTRFVGVETCNGIECLHIEFDSEIKHYYPPPPRESWARATRPAPATTMNSLYTGTLTTHTVWFLPIDATISAPRRSTASSIRYYDEGSVKGQKYRRETTYKRQEEIRVLSPTTKP